MISNIPAPAAAVTPTYIAELVAQQRSFFATGVTRSVKWRKQQLQALKEGIAKYEDALLEALHKDLGKHPNEAYVTDLSIPLLEIQDALKNLDEWASPESRRTPLFHLPAKSMIISEPYGVTLIIAPWNYPFLLLMTPLVGAIAAGNTAVLKPSEFAPHTAAVTAALIAEVFPPEYITTVQGDAEVGKALLQEKYDYIFFTGGVEVGRAVYVAAARHLTPVTLELGGKSPTIVDKDTNISLTARRIIWGKIINSGQTCVAPDYIMVHREVKDKLMEALQAEIKYMLGDDIQSNPAYSRIVNQRHYRRVAALLEGQTIFCGGERDESKLFIAPTIVDNPHPDSPIMQEEIFGPLLPVLTYDRVEDVIQFVNSRAKPLSLYIFSRSSRFINRILGETSSGNAAVNEVTAQFAQLALPVGGVGDSGTGACHGKYSFDAFSHKKSVLQRSFLIDLPLRYQPNLMKMSLSTLKRLIKVTLR